MVEHEPLLAVFVSGVVIEMKPSSNCFSTFPSKDILQTTNYLQIQMTRRMLKKRFTALYHHQQYRYVNQMEILFMFIK